MESKVNPFELYDKLGGWGIVLSLLIVGLPVGFKAITLWSRLRHDSFPLSNRRTQGLRELAQNEAWKTASALTLQLGISDALGVVMDDRPIRFVFDRHRPILLLKDLKKAGGIVRFNVQERKFEPTRRARPGAWSYRAKSILAFVSGSAPYAAMVFILPWIKDFVPRDYLFLVLCLIILWLNFSFGLASVFESAHRLVEKLDDVYPPITPVTLVRESGIISSNRQLVVITSKNTSRLSDREIKYFLLGFLFLIVSLVFLYLFSDPDPKEKFEFISYAFPCAAGILAGGAFYLSTRKTGLIGRPLRNRGPQAGKESDEKFFYICSVICLFAGLLAEVLSSKCRSQSAVLVCVVFVLFALGDLIARVLGEGKKYGWKSVGLVGWTLTGIAVVSSSLSLVYLIWHVDAFFIQNTWSFICVP